MKGVTPWLVAFLACLCLISAWRLLRLPRHLMNAGLEANDAEDYSLAFDHFSQAAENNASLVLQKNVALTAFQAGDLQRAAELADVIAQRGEDKDLAWRDFFLGNLAWRRSELAEFEAHGPVPPAGALERSISHAQDAQLAWRSAEETLGTWPAAERNLERVALRLSALEKELQSRNGGEGQDVDKLPVPPEQKAPELSLEQQQKLMEQLDRLDLKTTERRAKKNPEPKGGWKW